jgi:zinc finger HIT domain-containing protein 1
MPLITELPISQTTRPSHGWAYVPDTGVPIAAMAASTRKRGAPRDANTNKLLPTNNPSVKQQKATAQRLERLAEDNWSKQTVPLPTRTRIKKSTQNVRRILASERQFKHWHDEQVAQLALGAGAMVGTTTASVATGGSRRTSTAQAAQMPMHPPPKPSTPRIKTEVTATKSSPLASAPTTEPAEGDSLDTKPLDSLLVTRGIPKMPTKRLMDALLAEPPLSWDAAVARPLENRLPGRHFCAVCGYWGKVRCKRCGERTCGLMECWKGHEGSCAVPAY